MENDLLLRLPHRFLTLSLPKCLRVFFRHDRKLFSEVSKLIFDIVQGYFNEAARTAVESAAVLCFQSFGDFLRWNPYWQAIVVEGGFDENGNFIHIPFGNLQEMTECFRRRVIKFFLDSKLINQDMADTLLRWRHSGFSVDPSCCRAEAQRSGRALRSTWHVLQSRSRRCASKTYHLIAYPVWKKRFRGREKEYRRAPVIRLQAGTIS